MSTTQIQPSESLSKVKENLNKIGLDVGDITTLNTVSTADLVQAINSLIVSTEDDIRSAWVRAIATS